MRALLRSYILVVVQKSPARALQRALVARFARMAACQPCLPQRTYPGPSSLPGGRPRARATRVSPRATPDDAVILLASPPRGEEQEEEPRGVRVRDFVDAFERAERDAHSDLNPSGACDLTRAESRLLEGKESARGWALGGIERAAPTTGAELKAEAARVLVDAGFGTPLTEGWLDPGWLTVLSTNAEAAAVEHVVEACVETFRVETSSDESSSSSDGARAATTPAATKIKPPASSSSRRIDRRFSGHDSVIITSRWSRRTRRRSAGTSRAGRRRASLAGGTRRGRASRRLFSETPRPPPASSSPRAVSDAYAWCDARDSCHAIADETRFGGVCVFFVFLVGKKRRERRLRRRRRPSRRPRRRRLGARRRVRE